MAAISLCPRVEDLQALVQGHSSPNDLERLSQHLEQCGACADTVEGFLNTAPEYRFVPGKDWTAEAWAAPEVTALIDKLLSLAANPTVTGNETPAGVPALAKDSPERLDFLSPPQAPDEFGRLGAYRVLKVLGGGGMGIVFEAEDVQLRRRVALKVIKPALAAQPHFHERFLREARAAAAVRHDHIVTIYQVGEDRGVPFMAMELLEGTSLDTELRAKPVLLVADTLRIGRQIADGLAAAHARGLVHRDIKPGNVWLEPDGRVKILDFGLARAFAGAEGETDPGPITHSGVIIGTPTYMAPEQARGGLIDHRCDLFSLGCTLYRMTTGFVPFPGKDALSSLAALALDVPKAPHEVNPLVPPPLSALVLELLAKQPAGRPTSAREVSRRLADIERSLEKRGETTAAALQSTNAPATIRTPRRHPLLAAAALLLALVLPATYFGGTIVRFVTNKGVLVVEVDDPNVEIAVKRNGLYIHDKSNKRDFELSPGDGEIEVYEPASGLRLTTRKFTLTRGSTERLSVTQEVAKAKADLRPVAHHSKDPDRTAAEWALSIGCPLVQIRINEVEKVLVPGQEMPAQPFTVLGISLARNPRVKDADLENLRGLSQLRRLDLEFTRIGDPGLAHLQGLSQLKSLNLMNNPGESLVTDAGLAHLKSLANLEVLCLRHLRIGDAGLAQLQGLKSLKELTLNSAQVSEAGLTHLKGLTNLEHLELREANVGDSGLEHFKRFAKLRHLDLGNTSRVTDGGVEHLKELFGLTYLNLHRTKVSDAGVLHLTGLTNLEGLDLTGTGVGDAGLAHIKGLAKLVLLELGETRISDAGLAHLRGMTKLVRVGLSHTRVSSAGLKHVNGMTGLTHLYLQHTRVDDDGLAQLRDLGRLEVLDLSYTRVTDAGIERLLLLPNISVLYLDAARVSARGFATLRTALPRCKFNWSEPNHLAAEAVLALKGTVRIRAKGQKDDRPVRTVAELPADYFQVTSVGLAGVPILTEEMEAHLRRLRDPDFDALRALDLTGVKVESNQLDSRRRAHVGLHKAFPHLTELSLARSPITNDALSALKSLTNLSDLSLAETPVTDAGLRHLKEVRNLRRLVLDGCAIAGPGLAELKDLPQLTDLSVCCSTLTDEFANRLGAIRQVQRLSLAGSGLTDQGLAALEGLNKLRVLDLTGTKVTAAGVAKLRKALPACKITLSGAEDADRRAAQWVLSIGGTVLIRVAEKEQEIKASQHLPAQPFQIVEILLNGNQQVTNAGLAHLQGLTKLQKLELHGTPVTDAGLEHLKGLKELTYLALPGTQVSDAGLAHLRGLTKLAALFLSGVKVSDAGLAHLRGLINLNVLDLTGSQVSDAGLTHLEGLTNLTRLGLEGTDVSDAGLVHLKGLTKLTDISLVQTRVSGAGLAHLKALINLQSLVMYQTPVNDAGLAHLQGLVNLQRLHLSRTSVGDAGMAHLKGLKNLRELFLSATSVGDAGVAHLKGLTNLALLDLDGTRVTDAGLSHLQGLTNLNELRLSAKSVSDAGLAHFKGLTNLERLDLQRTSVTDVGMAHLNELTNLRALDVTGTKVTAAGVAKLQKALPECKIAWQAPSK